jgi:DNA polymerase elongation subunit (family B)
MTDDLVFHLLDIQTRDGYVASENKTSKEVVYESVGDGEGDAEFRPWGRRKTTSNFGKGRREYTVHLFGNTAQGQTVRVDVTGFRPYFYIKLPSSAGPHTHNQAKKEIQRYIEGQLNSRHNVGDEFTYKVVSRRDFIGFTGRREYAFLRISVPSVSAFRDCRGLFLDKENRPETRVKLGGPWEGIAPAVYEANIDPMLRFIHDTGIKPCDWIAIKDAGEFLADAEKGELLVLDADVSCIGPAQSGPKGAATAPFLKAFWDIECYSETGDFPVAKRTWAKAAKDILLAVRDGKITRAAQIHDEIRAAIDGNSSAVGHILCEPITTKGFVALNKAGENNGILEEIFATGRNWTDLEKAKQDVCDKLNKLYSVQNKAVVLRGDPVIQIGTILTRGSADSTERHLFTFNTCAEIPGAVVHAYKDEEEMIEEWFKWLVKVNPDELVGYNVFGFDERYLWERCEVSGLTEEGCAIHELSRLSDQGNTVKLAENRLSSSALGDNFLYTWTTAGRLQVDLYFYVKRSGASLTSYKLDDVAKHYMSGKVKTVQVDSESQEIILNCGGAVGDVRPGRSLQLMDDIGESVCDKIRVLRVDLKDSKSGIIVCSAADLTEDERETIAHGTKWSIVKDDVSPQDIFRLWRGTAEDRARIGGYCVQDCELVMELYKKLEVFNNSMSMANVCLVPISFIFMRGQGVKIESLIFRECAAAGTLIPVLENPPQTIEGVPEESYEGAIVLDPEPGLYKDSPVGVCDFASLYPSTIISENISHDMLVWVRDYKDNGDLIENVWGGDEFADLDDHAYTDIEFDLLKPDPADRRKNPEKIRCGRRICRYAEPLDGTKGLLPEIIKKLLAARKAKRKEAEREENPERKNLLDAEQLAYKITANSLYGQLGSKTFKVRLVYLAASVTAYARKQLLFSKDCIERFYGPGAGDPRCAVKADAKIVYGDSVTGDTPLIIKYKNIIQTIRIDELELLLSQNWTPYNMKEEIQPSSINNEIYVWSSTGWTKIKRIIRHILSAEKKLYRINTHNGIVDCTDDHSLVLSNGLEVKPDNVGIGTELLHKEFDDFIEVNCDITKGEAFVMGLFVADGSSDVYKCPSGTKASWAINKADMKLLEKAQMLCPFETKILNTLESSGVYKLVPVGNITEISRKYRKLFYNHSREKKIPSCILNAANDILSEFWNGFYSGDGDKGKNCVVRFDQKGKEIGTGLTFIAKKLGFNVSINERASKVNTFRYTMTLTLQRKNADAIKKIRLLPSPDNKIFVYDLETDNHHFGVGPGSLIVHNTDSIFAQVNPRNPETGERLQGRDARQAAIDLTEEMGHFITQALRPPHDFEFDKIFDPLLMFSKKRYAGKMYESNADDFVYKYMGIALKRRDNAPIVKTVFGGAMRELLDRNDVAGAAELVKKVCDDLVEGRMSMGQLTITKSLRAEYANANGVAHKVLAERMAARDPGNAPAAGDRIPYVYILPPPGQVASKLQGDRIETPAWVRSHNLKPDYSFYLTNQIQNPVCEMFAIVIRELPGFTGEHEALLNKIEDGEMRLVRAAEIAAEILLGPALAKCAAAAKMAFAAKFFGGGGGGGGDAQLPQNSIASRTRLGVHKKAIENQAAAQVAQAATPKPSVQSSIPSFFKESKNTPATTKTYMDSYLYDSMVVNKINKERSEKKKASKKTGSSSAEK